MVSGIHGWQQPKQLVGKRTRKSFVSAMLTMAALADHAVAHDQRGLLLAGMLDASKLGDGA